MLLPTIVKVSDKGQILIPAKIREALGLAPKEYVYIIPKPEEKKIEIERIGKDLIEASYGMLADIEPGRSWTQELVEERRRDNIREETKFDSLFKKKAKKDAKRRS